MANKKIELALVFLKTYPAEAAELLEEQRIEDVATFLGEVPHTHAAEVVGKMLPAFVAKLCKVLKPEQCAGFLSLVSVNQLASVFRHLGPEKRKELSKHLSAKRNLACSLLLNYSDDTVGSQMLTQVITLSLEVTAGNALNQIATGEQLEGTDTLFVVDRQRRLQGEVKVGRLLRAQPDTLVASIMEPRLDVISGRTTLITAGEHPGWGKRDTLPVINRENEFIGIIRHVDLRAGLERISSQFSKRTGEDPLSNLLDVYGKSFVALFNTLGGWVLTKK